MCLVLLCVFRVEHDGKERAEATLVMMMAVLVRRRRRRRRKPTARNYSLSREGRCVLAGGGWYLRSVAVCACVWLKWKWKKGCLIFLICICAVVVVAAAAAVGQRKEEGKGEGQLDNVVCPSSSWLQAVRQSVGKRMKRKGKRMGGSAAVRVSAWRACLLHTAVAPLLCVYEAAHPLSCLLVVMVMVVVVLWASRCKAGQAGEGGRPVCMYVYVLED